jgi:hypothetical protein
MNKKHLLKVSPLVGAVLLALSAPVAMAATVTPPAANVLPGAFYTNSADAGYTGTAANAATIGVSNGATVLQFGGSSAGVTTSVAATSGITTAAGFNIGAGASLTVNNSAAALTTSAVLINDITGNPSQIYGSLTAASGGIATGAPTLFVANANGVIVGGTGKITLPEGGGIIGEAQNPANFTANTAVYAGTGTGVVNVMPGASVTATTGYLLVAGNGNVNIGGTVSNAVHPSTAIIAGYGFSNAPAAAVSVAPASGLGVMTAVSTATVNLSSAASLATADVYAAGNVNILSGSTVHASSATFTSIGGAFTNNGTVTLGRTLTAPSILNNGTLYASGGNATATATGTGGIINNGTLNASIGVLTLNATSGAAAPITNNGTITAVDGLLTASASGNFVNNGTIQFSDMAGGFNITAQNVTLAGSVMATAGTTGYAALSATNAITGGTTLATNQGTAGGIVLLGTTLYTNDSTTDTLTGQSVRMLSNSGLVNVSAGGAVTASIGTPSTAGGSNLGLAYAGGVLAGNKVKVDGTTGSTITLGGGTLGNSSTAKVDVTGGSIQMYNGKNGIAVSSGATVNFQLSGNVNNPHGDTTSQIYYFRAVPIDAQGSKNVVTVNVDPTATASTAQYMNLYVNGTPTLTSTNSSPVSIGGSSGNITKDPLGAFSVQATGNITFGTGSGFYFPGTLYASNVTQLGAPFAVNPLGSITVNGLLSNVVTSSNAPQHGIWLLTNDFVAAGTGNQILTNQGSAVNFTASSGLSTVNANGNATNKAFYTMTQANGYMSSSLLPATYFNGRIASQLP